MNEPNNHVYRGFNAGHVCLALLAGAVAGAGVAYLTAPQSGLSTRNRLRTIVHDTNETAHRVPDAVRKATEVAREAFVNALDLDVNEEEDVEVVVTKRKRGDRKTNPQA
jgi:gas vesicle protein